MKEINAKAYAKLNPSLEVLSKREDGYHELDLTYLTINIYDEIKVKPKKEEKIELSSNSDIPPEKNLCFRAAKTLQRETGKKKGAKIKLQKNIPAGGGLGGGSSDAAAVLAGLNMAWDRPTDENALKNIGGGLGSDVPFFFLGGYCRGRGRGTKLTRKENPYEKRKFLVLNPGFSLSTPKVYSRYDTLTEKSKEKRKEKDLFDNDLTEAALRLEPALGEYFDFLSELKGIEDWGLSGSGSSTFGLIEKGSRPEKLKKKLEAAFPKSKIFISSTIRKGHKLKVSDER